MGVGDKIPVINKIGNTNNTPVVGDRIINYNTIGFTSSSPSVGDKIGVVQKDTGKVGFLSGGGTSWATENYTYSVSGVDYWYGIIRRQATGGPVRLFLQSRDIDTLSKVNEVEIPGLARGALFYPDDGLSADSDELYRIAQSGGTASATVYSTKTGGSLRTGTISGLSTQSTSFIGSKGYLITNYDYVSSNLWNIYLATDFSLVKQCSWGSKKLTGIYCGDDDVLISNYNNDKKNYKAKVSDCSIGSSVASLGQYPYFAIKDVDNYLIYSGLGRATTFKKYEDHVLTWTKTIDVVTYP